MNRTLSIKRILVSFFAITLVFALFGCQNENNNNTNNDVSIVFDTGDMNVVVSTLKGKPGEAVNAPEAPIRDGYKFSHWTLDGVEYTFSVFPDKTIILHAVWKNSYKLSFNTGGNGTDIEPDYYFEGETIGELPVAANKALNDKIYAFKGWLLDGEPFSLTKMPKSNVELTADYEEKNGVIFNVDGDINQVPPTVVEAGKKITVPAVEPVKDGYVFSCWQVNNQPYIFGKMPNGNLTVTAKFILESAEYNSRLTLPKLMINLEGNLGIGAVQRETYVNSQISILNTEEENMLYSVTAEFKGRGNGSWTSSGQKKGYRIKFSDKQSVFGEAKSKHWVILACTNFNDRSLAKNKTAFDMTNEIFTGIEYASSANYVEVYFNGNYHGVYILCEHVRVDENRVNIESDFVTEKPESTGYLIEYDNYAEGTEGIDYFQIPNHSSFAVNQIRKFTMKSPDPEDYEAEGLTDIQYRAQVTYIKDFTIKALTPMLNKNYAEFAKWCDVDSFVDMYILHELFKNVDTGFSSFFLYKKAGIDKLYAGPPWDFDASIEANDNRNMDKSPTGIFVAGSAYNTTRFTTNMFYYNIYQTTEFKAKVKERWSEISDSIKTFVENAFADSYLQENKTAMGRNFKYWSRDSSYGYANNQTTAENNWVSASNAVKNWLLSRVTWLNGEWNKG